MVKHQPLLLDTKQETGQEAVSNWGSAAQDVSMICFTPYKLVKKKYTCPILYGKVRVKRESAIAQLLKAPKNYVGFVLFNLLPSADDY